MLETDSPQFDLTEASYRDSTDPLIIINPDRSLYVQVDHNGTVTGELAEKYPDSLAAISELTLRIVREFRVASGR